MDIIKGEIIHIPVIRDIALGTWPDTYGQILSGTQMEYMMDMMYSENALENQMLKLGHHFLLIKTHASSSFQGFVSFEYDYKGENKTKLHKLYVLPDAHGLGFGKILIGKVCDAAREWGNSSVLLNMNRDNKALAFYRHVGFDIIGEEDIDIGDGFLMEDYIFEKQV